MFGSWKKILEYLELVFELLTQSKAELEALKEINSEIATQNQIIYNIEDYLKQIRDKLNEKEG